MPKTQQHQPELNGSCRGARMIRRPVPRRCLDWNHGEHFVRPTGRQRYMLAAHAREAYSRFARSSKRASSSANDADHIAPPGRSQLGCTGDPAMMRWHCRGEPAMLPSATSYGHNGRRTPKATEYEGILPRPEVCAAITITFPTWSRAAAMNLALGQRMCSLGV